MNDQMAKAQRFVALQDGRVLESMQVGEIGMALGGELRIVDQVGQLLRIDSSDRGLGSNDNGATYFDVPLQNQGTFYLRNYDPVRIQERKYTQEIGDYLEVVAVAEDGLPILEPFDSVGARRLVVAEAQ